MIRPAGIQKKANKERVRDTQIEKDYILTWISTAATFCEAVGRRKPHWSNGSARDAYT